MHAQTILFYEFTIGKLYFSVVYNPTLSVIIYTFFFCFVIYFLFITWKILFYRDSANYNIVLLTFYYKYIL